MAGAGSTPLAAAHHAHRPAGFVIRGHDEAAAQLADLLAEAPPHALLIVLTADLKAWKKSPERYWRNAAPEIQKLVISREVIKA